MSAIRKLLPRCRNNAKLPEAASATLGAEAVKLDAEVAAIEANLYSKVLLELLKEGRP